MNTPTDNDLETMIRAGLRRHAADAPTDLGAPLPSSGEVTADSDLPTHAHSRLRWLAPAAAAAVAIAVPGGILVRNLLSDGSATVASPSTSTLAQQNPTRDPAARPAGIPADWRSESYAGVQVWVPPTWGWGGAPARFDWNGGESIDCASWRAYTRPGSSAYEQMSADLPYVGRPVMMTDACAGAGGGHPSVDAVIFGAVAIEPGTETYSDGMVRETRNVGSVGVTVFSKDAALRAQILDSASEVSVDANGCPTVAPDVGKHSTWSATGEATGMSVCAYDQSDRLLFSTTSSPAAAATYAAATTKGEPLGEGRTAAPAKEYDRVFIRVTLASGQGRFDHFSPSDGQYVVRDAAGRLVTVAATEANVAPWAKNNGAVKAYVAGGSWSDSAPWQRWFRGILG
ncbi:MAG: hypothetical protein LCH77_03330 [Actinobacteria bacterium]|nr:hypothetical protein [Actinomycetota bacterium]